MIFINAMLLCSVRITYFLKLRDIVEPYYENNAAKVNL